jgi:AcrR family transcriptional regulator
MAPSTGRTDNQLNAKPPIGGQPVSKIIPPARAAAWGPGVDVALQARAEVTRQKIIDSAVALFGTAGFGDTGLADIISHADVTKGSFSYHFDSKDAVATAIIEKSEEEFLESTIKVLSSPSSPALDNLIRSTFAVIHAHKHDTLTRVANQLGQSLAQVSSAGSATYVGRQAVVFTVMTDAIKRGIGEGASPTRWTSTAWHETFGPPPWATVYSPTPWATTSLVSSCRSGGCCCAPSFPPSRFPTSTSS